MTLHSVEFDAQRDSPDIEVLDYQYGELEKVFFCRSVSGSSWDKHLSLVTELASCRAVNFYTSSGGSRKVAKSWRSGLICDTDSPRT